MHHVLTPENSVNVNFSTSQADGMTIGDGVTCSGSINLGRSFREHGLSKLIKTPQNPSKPIMLRIFELWYGSTVRSIEPGSFEALSYSGHTRFENYLVISKPLLHAALDNLRLLHFDRQY